MHFVKLRVGNSIMFGGDFFDTKLYVAVPEMCFKTIFY